MANKQICICFKKSYDTQDGAASGCAVGEIAQLAETIGTTSQYVNRIIKKKDGVVNKTFVQMLEALGYDIELNYVKREG